MRTWLDSLRRLMSYRGKRRAAARLRMRVGRKPLVEMLEDRCLPAFGISEFLVPAIGSPLAAVTSQAVAGGSQATFIFHLYDDMLDRDPTPADLAAWQSAMNQGATPQQVVQGFLSSQEHRDYSARELYSGLVGRPGSPSEVATA